MRLATLHVSVVLVGLYAAFEPMFADADALAFLEAHTSQYTQELIDLVKLPSISSLPGTSRQMLFRHLQKSIRVLCMLWPPW